MLHISYYILKSYWTWGFKWNKAHVYHLSYCEDISCWTYKGVHYITILVVEYHHTTTHVMRIIFEFLMNLHFTHSSTIWYDESFVISLEFDSCVVVEIYHLEVAKDSYILLYYTTILYYYYTMYVNQLYLQW